jgi:hypothetical protein
MYVWERERMGTHCFCCYFTDGQALDAIGSATFFALITVCILSPSMPLAIYLFATLTMGLGMLLGWAGGIAAFASGLNVRDQARLQQQMQEVQQR